MENEKNKSVFEVAEKRCNECLFGPNKIVDDKRRRDVLQDCMMNSTYFSCHKYTLVDRDACCRGFYDRDPRATIAMRLAIMLDVVRFVTLPEEETD